MDALPLAHRFGVDALGALLLLPPPLLEPLGLPLKEPLLLPLPPDLPFPLPPLEPLVSLPVLCLPEVLARPENEASRSALVTGSDLLTLLLLGVL